MVQTKGAPLPPYGHIVRPRVRGGVRLTIPPRLNLPPGHASGMTAVRACVPRAGEGILAPYLRVGVASGYDPGAALTFPALVVSRENVSGVVAETSALRRSSI